MSSRIKVLHQNNSLTIKIPLIKNPYVIVPLIGLLVFWGFAERYFIREVFQSHRESVELIIASITLAWTIAGFAIAAILFWTLFGSEKIRLNNKYLSTQKPIVIYLRHRAYAIEDISDFRISRERYKIRRNNEWTDSERVVMKFNTPYKNVTFGRGINQEEADFILLTVASSNFLNANQFSNVI